jgi:hypothetical protein
LRPGSRAGNRRRGREATGLRKTGERSWFDRLDLARQLVWVERPTWPFSRCDRKRRARAAPAVVFLDYGDPRSAAPLSAARTAAVASRAGRRSNSSLALRFPPQSMTRSAGVTGFAGVRARLTVSFNRTPFSTGTCRYLLGVVGTARCAIRAAFSGATGRDLASGLLRLRRVSPAATRAETSQCDVSTRFGALNRFGSPTERGSGPFAPAQHSGEISGKPVRKQGAGPGWAMEAANNMRINTE